MALVTSTSPRIGPAEGRFLFVVGASRSGTSLTKNLLSADPEVSIAPETHFLDRWVPRFWNGDDAMVGRLWSAYRQHPHVTHLGLPAEVLDAIGRSDNLRDLFARLITAHATSEGASVAGEKTPGHFRQIGRLLDWYPASTVVFVVRDPRAVVASLHAFDADWARGTTFRHVRLWCDAADAAVHWGEHPQVHLVRYEDLVADPLRTIGPIHRTATGHDFDPSWLTATNPVTEDRRRGWEGRLSSDEAQMIAHVCADRMAALGFAAEPSSPSLRARARYEGERLLDGGARLARAAARPIASRRRRRFRAA